MINNVLYKTPEEKTTVVKFGEQEGQGMGPLLPIQQSGNSLPRKS
jgi:hypothetical protein